MKVTIAGAGYVGPVTGACLAEVGSDVVCPQAGHEKDLDIKYGEVRISEPALAAMVKTSKVADRLRFTNNGN